VQVCPSVAGRPKFVSGEVVVSAQLEQEATGAVGQFPSELVVVPEGVSGK
jgi:hypothetical protein